MRDCINGSYNALGGMPWNDVRKQVLTVEFQSDMAAFSYCNLNYWFYSCVNLTGVSGWSYLAGVHEMKYTFSSCTSPDAVPDRAGPFIAHEPAVRLLRVLRARHDLR